MRIPILLLVVSLLCVTAASAATIDKGTLEFSGAVGYGFPLGAFGDVADPGIGFGGMFSYHTSPKVSIGVTVMKNTFGVPSELDEVGVDADLSVTEITAHYKATFGEPKSTQFYGRAIVGAFRNTVSATGQVEGLDVSASITETDIGIGAGFGLQFRGEGSAGGFVEALLFSDFTEGETTNYFSLRGGFSFFVTPSE